MGGKMEANSSVLIRQKEVGKISRYIGLLVFELLFITCVTDSTRNWYLRALVELDLDMVGQCGPQLKGYLHHK